MVIRMIVGAVAVAPFVLLLVAMLTGRAQVKSCCGTRSVTDGEPGDASVPTPTTHAVAREFTRT